jgi:hypothetical protein
MKMKEIAEHTVKVLFAWISLVWYYFLLIADMPDIVRVTSSGVSVLLIQFFWHKIKVRE